MKLIKAICKFEMVNNIIDNHNEEVNKNTDIRHALHCMRRMKDDLNFTIGVLNNAIDRIENDSCCEIEFRKIIDSENEIKDRELAERENELFQKELENESKTMKDSIKYLK